MLIAHGENGSAYRADMARLGWSVTNDIPRRLAWGDAWALFEHLAQDPSTWLCASIGGMDYPADRLTLTVMSALGVEGPFTGKARRASKREIDKARRGMSARFQHLYEENS